MSDTLILKSGESTAIEMPFVGNPQPKVSWTYNAGKFPDAKRMKSQTIVNMTSMTLAKAVRKDSGDYKVTLSNDYGEASFTIHLTVLGRLSGGIKANTYIYFLLRSFKCTLWQ